MHRRQFLAALPALALLGTTRTVSSQPFATPPRTESTPTLKVGGYAYDRVNAIREGVVGVPGHQVAFTPSNIYDLLRSALGTEQIFDVTEMGLLPFLRAYVNEGFRDYTLLPIFPLRMFRHKSIFIRTDRGILKPSDLRGKTIGTPGYSSTSLTWIRGLLQDEYGVSR